MNAMPSPHPQRFPARQRRAILNKLHTKLGARKRCLSLQQIADFINDEIPGWAARVAPTQHTPSAKYKGSRLAWRGKTQHGKTLSVLIGDRLLFSHNSTEPYQTNSYALQELLNSLGCGHGTTKHASEELRHYAWFNPYGEPKDVIARRFRARGKASK